MDEWLIIHANVQCMYIIHQTTTTTWVIQINAKVRKRQAREGNHNKKKNRLNCCLFVCFRGKYLLKENILKIYLVVYQFDKWLGVRSKWMNEVLVNGKK